MHKLPLPFRRASAWELSGWYSSPSIWGGTYKTAAQGSIDAACRKNFLKTAAPLKLSITDIFHTAPVDSVSDFGGLYVEADGDWESRPVPRHLYLPSW
jgi:hypothetical protein